MQLLYLYIKDYRKFKNQNLNFGSEFTFNYSEETKILDIQKNELYIKDHYEIKKDNRAELLNITSIIGQNGTGKTSILNFIRENFVEGSYLNKPSIFITKEADNIVIYFTEEFDIKTKSFENIDFVLKKLNLKKEKLEFDGATENDFISFGYNFRGFKNTDIIYFSNVFDFPGGSNLKGIYDITTNNLILNDFKNDIENKELINYEKGNHISSFINNDLNRQIKFIKNYYSSDKIPFKLPDNLKISVKNNFFLADFNFDTFQKYRLFKNFQKFIKNVEVQSFKNNDEAERFKFRFIINIYINFLVDVLFSYQGIDNLFDINKIIFFDINKTIDYNYIKDKLDLINITKNQIFSNNKSSSKKFESMIKLLEMINEIDTKSSNDIYFDNYNLIIKIEGKGFNSFKNFMDNYEDSFIIRPFLNFYWDNISSGEKALLNFYSRFYSLSNGQKFGNNLNEHLLILIDEGDLYLHPEWQKRFVKILIDFLPIIFESKSNSLKRTIQIIFTTNSPIPASDLLSYNTIFLENSINEMGESLTIVKDSLNEQKETFAANIHTLLSDSFFVKGGLIGDFASDKLNQIIDELIKRVVLSKEERENMRKLIHQIGEPVLKTKLMQMYNERFNMEIHERLDEIEKKLGI